MFDFCGRTPLDNANARDIISISAQASLRGKLEYSFYQQATQNSPWPRYVPVSFQGSSNDIPNQFPSSPVCEDMVYRCAHACRHVCASERLSVYARSRGCAPPARLAPARHGLLKGAWSTGRDSLRGLLLPPPLAGWRGTWMT